MFNKIPHPHTGKMYPTLSPEGKSILEKYKNELKQNQESVEFPSGPPPQPFQNGGTGLTTSSAPISINLPGTIPGLPPSPKSNESYLQTFFKDVKVQPSCSNTQLKELDILIKTINNYILEQGNLNNIEKEINNLKKQKEALKTNPPDKLVSFLANKYSLSTPVAPFYSTPAHRINTLYREFRDAKQDVSNHDSRTRKVTSELDRLRDRITVKKGLQSTTATDSDYEQLARWNVDLNRDTGENEKKNFSETRKELIDELIKRLDANIVTEKKKINKGSRKIYMSGTDYKCIIKSNNTKLEITNLVLKYGNSSTDRGAVDINIDVQASHQNPYNLLIKINKLPMFNTPFNIMIPKSIFLLDLSNLIGNNDDDVLDYIIDGFTSSAKNTNKKIYLTQFIGYILSFADNLVSGDIDKTIINVYKSPATLKIIALLEDTYHIKDDTNEKHNILVKINNFTNYSKDSSTDKIAIDLRMAIIPSYSNKINVTTENEIIIDDYSHSNNLYKKYGKLNFYKGDAKIVDDYILGLATPSWCPLF